jgi:hypothetical protein
MSSKSTVLLAAFVLAALLVQACKGGSSRLARTAAEIRNRVAEVDRAIAERTPARPNLDEICLRVGNLHQTARYELEENLADERTVPAEARRIADRLIQDAKSLPSFCGDDEKATQDPGYEAVARGDVAAVQKELANIAERATQLEQLVLGAGKHVE